MKWNNCEFKNKVGEFNCPACELEAGFSVLTFLIHILKSLGIIHY